MLADWVKLENGSLKPALQRDGDPAIAGIPQHWLLGHLEHELPASSKATPARPGPSGEATNYRTRGEALEEKFPGATAEGPGEIPKKGWLQVLKRAWAEAKIDQVPLLAAGVAFYSFLSLFPAMIAAVTIYGLVADPATVQRQTAAISDALPADAASIITAQMEAGEGSLGEGRSGDCDHGADGGIRLVDRYHGGVHLHLFRSGGFRPVTGGCGHC